MAKFYKQKDFYRFWELKCFASMAQASKQYMKNNKWVIVYCTILHMEWLAINKSIEDHISRSIDNV